MADEGKGSNANWGAVAGAAISSAANIGAGSVASKKEYHQRKKLMQLAYEQDLANWHRQNAYNTPAAQRARFEAAKLNPALMYGTGSASSGNASDYPKARTPEPRELMSVFGNMGSSFMDMLSTIKLKNSQTELNEQKTDESGIKSDLMEAQKAVVQANPYLNSSYLNAVVQNMKATATAKAAETNALWKDGTSGIPSDPKFHSLGQKKIMIELETLTEKYKLMQADQKLKAEILQSKEFQNDLQKIQLEWMQNGEITPQHIYQGILLLLQKMM